MWGIPGTRENPSGCRWVRDRRESLGLGHIPDGGASPGPRALPGLAMPR